jgi:branched-subunit amino acid transport protein AzlD
MPNTHSALIIAVMALVTALTRFLPFWVFDGKRQVPGWIRYLGSVLPYSIMAMLVVYCLKDISLASISGWLPAAISVGAVVGLHMWKRNTLLGIIRGTVCYMVLIRIIL